MDTPYKYLLSSCALVLCLPRLGVGQIMPPSVPPNPSPDVQTNAWGIVGMSMPLSDRVEINTIGAYVSGLNLKGVLIEMPVKLNKHLSVAPSYIYIAAPPIANRKFREHQARFEGTGSLHLGRFVFDDRNIFERHIRSTEDFWIYGNRARVSLPLRVQNLNLIVFAYDEALYDWGKSKWNRNLIAVGANCKLSERLTFEFSYRREMERDRSDTDAFVTALVVRLPRFSRWRR